MLERFRIRQARARWAAIARKSPRLDPATLSRLARDARSLRASLDTVLRAAEVVQPPSDLPHAEAEDWRHRPGPWAASLSPSGVVSPTAGHRLGDDVAVFHDCPLGEIAVRQIRNRKASARAPFGLWIDVLGFRGSYVSVVVDLPASGVAGLTRDHVLSLDTRLSRETAGGLLARLNVRHGPNIARSSRPLDPRHGGARVEFDLAYTEIDEVRIDAAWIDVILEAPRMTALNLTDLVIGRRRRTPV